jgi:hypothetical protein
MFSGARNSEFGFSSRGKSPNSNLTHAEHSPTPSSTEYPNRSPDQIDFVPTLAGQMRKAAITEPPR